MFSQLFGTGLGIGQGFIDNALASEKTKDDRRENYMYGEMAAENADRRTRALYNDLYSVKAKMEQAKEAGLSPSVLFSGGQALGAQGSSAGAQGSGPTGLQTPVYGLEMAQTMKTLAETNLIEEQTKTEGGKNDMGSAKITKLLADAGAAKANEKYTSALTYYQNIQNYISETTQEDTIQKIVEESKKAAFDAAKALEEANTAGITFEIASATKEDEIKLVREKVSNLAADTLLKQAQKELAEEEKVKLIADIDYMIGQLVLEAEKNRIWEREVNAIETYYDGVLNNLEWRQKFDVWAKKLDIKQAQIDNMYGTLNSLIQMGGSMAIMNGMLNRPTQPTKLGKQTTIHNYNSKGKLNGTQQVNEKYNF